jgi:LysM repeat protein
MKLWYADKGLAGLVAVAFLAAGPVMATDKPLAETEVAEYYSVKQGETLQRIAQEHRLDMQELAAWNDLYPPYDLSAGQLLVTRPTSFQLASLSEKAGAIPAAAGKPEAPAPTAATAPAQALATPVQAEAAATDKPTNSFTKIDENGEIVIVEYVDFSKGPEPIVIPPPTGKPD